MHILHVVGARPNFMKVAPVLRALREREGVRQTLVHTGQHYDLNMSEAILRELGVPVPDVNLGVGSGSHAQQTAQVMLGLEPCLEQRKPDIVLVYGDINSTMGAALTAVKMGIRVGHVEAGLRSRDWSMPEEINRIVTDRLSSWLFTPSRDADANLLAEGADPATVCLVGNVMIDTLVRLLPLANPEPLLKEFGLLNGHGPEPYVLVTLHRPSNVDDPDALHRIVGTLQEIASEARVVFPIHPRTRSRLNGQLASAKQILLIDPLTYLQFLGLQRDAAVVVTDSGGIQEETTYLGVPCLTVRDNTERPVTVSLGTNQLVGSDAVTLRDEVRKALSGGGKTGTVPALWDGHAAERVADHLIR